MENQPDHFFTATVFELETIIAEIAYSNSNADSS